MTLVEERSLCGPCLDGLSAAQILLATALPEEVLSRLRAGANREGFDPRRFCQRWRFEWLTYRSLPSATVRLRWLGQRLFPAAGYLRSQYGFRNPLWLPWYYGVRIVRGVCILVRSRKTASSLSRDQ